MPDKERVLIIDDESDIVRSLSVRLRAAGYEVHSAADGLAGVNVAVEFCPAVILLDVRMPKLDGFEVLKWLRARVETSGIPVIVLSANAVEDTRSRVLALGARCFIAKPFQTKKLLGTISDVVETRRLEAAASNGG